jgi:hypothetical protein
MVIDKADATGSMMRFDYRQKSWVQDEALACLFGGWSARCVMISTTNSNPRQIKKLRLRRLFLAWQMNLALVGIQL